MSIDEEIIKKVLWEHFPDLSEWKINKIVKEMETRQNKSDKAFEDFVDRIL